MSITRAMTVASVSIVPSGGGPTVTGGTGAVSDGSDSTYVTYYLPDSSALPAPVIRVNVSGDWTTVPTGATGDPSLVATVDSELIGTAPSGGMFVLGATSYASAFLPFGSGTARRITTLDMGALTSATLSTISAASPITLDVGPLMSSPPATDWRVYEITASLVWAGTSGPTIIPPLHQRARMARVYTLHARGML